MCWEKKAVLAVVIILALLIIFYGGKGEALTPKVSTLNLNGAQVPITRNDMGWLTSGASLRDQTVFTSTNQ
jgi:hypothetical protein